MRHLIRRVLAGAGMQVVTHGSAAELLAAGDLATATVLLLDVNLPGMSGLALQDLLTDRGFGRPIVFLSGSSDLAMAMTAMRNGAADFIEKPFQGALLIERLQRAVARHAGGAAALQGVADERPVQGVPIAGDAYCGRGGRRRRGPGLVPSRLLAASDNVRRALPTY